MEIPIRNIFYLLSYAWDTLDQRGVVEVGQLEGSNFADLCAHVLIGGIRRLIKEGLEQQYHENTAELAVVRGRIDFHASAVRQSLERGKMVCHYDELTRASMPNRILRTTMRRLACVQALDAELRGQLLVLWKRLAEIPEIHITRSLFRSPVRQRKPLYGLLLEICEIVHESVAPEKPGHGSRFRDFFQDEIRMRILFERFVRNFYRRELRDHLVRSDQLKWAAIPEGPSDAGLLPSMKTDITIESKTKIWIIDTKYYVEALQVWHDTPKFKSDHLYQLFAYLKNAAETRGGLYVFAEGILLYPEKGQVLDHTYKIGQHRMRVCTVDLTADWGKIKDRLLVLVKPPSAALSATQIA